MCQKKLKTLPKNITIDGPAASGKTTIGTIVANKIGYMCLDTGIMYRAVAFQALKEGIEISDEAAVPVWQNGLKSTFCRQALRMDGSLT